MRTYLDTNVLIAAFRGTHKAHESAMALIEDPAREFLASDFLRLEVLPKPIFHRNDDEREFYEVYFAATLHSEETTPSAVASAFSLAATYGLSAPDALHAQAAISARADELVTLEKPTKPLSRISAGTLSVKTL